MLPKTHFILGFLFSIILLYIFPQIGIFGAGIILLSGFLIDADHYIFNIFKEKDLNLKNAYRWHLIKGIKMRKLSKEERGNYKNEILILHGFEPLIIILLFSFLWFPFIFIFIGFTFHLVIDVFEEIRLNHRIDKISVIYDIIKYKRLKKLDISF